jgi:signal transduction histidine kinase
MPQGSRQASPGDDPPLRPNLAAATLAGLILCAISIAVTLTGSTADEAGLVAAGRVLMFGLPVAVGLYAWRARPEQRFGPLLAAAGFGWFLTTLAESGNDVVYSVGRVAGWLVEAGLVYLVLSFPTGRLTDRVDRALVWAAGLLVATLYLPTALIVESYPVPSPYSSCTAGCPHNALLLLGSEPAAVGSFVRPLREVLAVLLFLAVTAQLVRRYRHATRLMQRTLEPVLTVAAARCAILAIALAFRRVNGDVAVLVALSWTVALAMPVMAAAFLVGLVSRRLYVASALEQLGRRVRSDLRPEQLRIALSGALGDPSLKVVYWSGRRWTEADGRPAAPPGPADRLTEVLDGDRRVAAIVHDAALTDREFLSAVASYALIALKNRQLASEVEASLREVQESRARILASADGERRRIERDLHDGAQQRLVALRIQIELAEGLLRRDPEAGIRKLHALGEEVGAALTEIRALAHGVYPSLLGDRGLAEALAAAALRAPIAASVSGDGVVRYPQEVESAVYFCCLEAIQNASKHARGARTIEISLTHDSALRFEVRDDGAGFDPSASPPGAGLTNMRDRLWAVGGELSVLSSAGGTVVAGSVPLPARAALQRGLEHDGHAPGVNGSSRRAGEHGESAGVGRATAQPPP